MRATISCRQAKVNGLPVGLGTVGSSVMGAFEAYAELPLRGGFVLRSVRGSDDMLTDALHRPALARMIIIGRTLEIELTTGLSAAEISVTLYHEVLEAAAVAASAAPPAVCELNEAGFDTVARQMYARLGAATPTALNQMLELFGF